MTRIDVSKLPGKLSGVLERQLPEFFARHEGLSIEAAKAGIQGFRAVAASGGSLKLEYGATADLLAALGDIVCDRLPKPSDEPSVPRFAFRGVSLDCSRNGAPTVKFLKDALARMSLMGLTHFCLYTEDTYEVAGEPLIGFARARYSKDEIRELVAFASVLGIEMFPCMQTLGHLEHILKYQDKFGPVSDNNRVLNVTLPETYALLEKMIDEIREPYQSKLIHLGADEPWGIGRGKSLDFEKPVKPSELYLRHLRRMAEICAKRGLTGVVWGDYVLGRSGEEAFSGDETNSIPKSLVMDYWSYCTSKAEDNASGLDTFKKLGYEIVVSPGLWNWNRFWGNTPYAIETTAPVLDAAAGRGVSKALMTMWGDDGQESLFDSNWASLSFYLSACREAAPKQELIDKRVELIAGISPERLKLIAEMENPDLDRDGYVNMRVCVGKPLLYDDPLLSFVNKLFKDELPFKHFSAMEEKLRNLKSTGPRDTRMKRLACAYANLLAKKFLMQRRLRLAAASKKKHEIKKALRLMPDVRKALRKFRDLYSEAWLAERKSFGLEIVEARLGGVDARLDSLRREMRRLVDGEIEEIAEFALENPPEIALHTMQCYCAAASKNHNALWI